MPYNTKTPERQAKIARYLRMIQRRSPVWDPEKFKALEEEREKKKKNPDQDK